MTIPKMRAPQDSHPEIHDRAWYLDEAGQRLEKFQASARLWAEGYVQCLAAGSGGFENALRQYRWSLQATARVRRIDVFLRSAIEVSSAAIYESDVAQLFDSHVLRAQDDEEAWLDVHVAKLEALLAPKPEAPSGLTAAEAVDKRFGVTEPMLYPQQALAEAEFDQLARITKIAAGYEKQIVEHAAKLQAEMNKSLAGSGYSADAADWIVEHKDDEVPPSEDHLKWLRDAGSDAYECRVAVPATTPTWRGKATF